MDDRPPMTPTRLADVLEKAIADRDTTADEFGEYVRMHLHMILPALRASDTGRSEAEAMRERCARWHDDQAAEYDREGRERTLPNGEWAGRDAMWARADAQGHREHAAAIRALQIGGHDHG